MASPIYFFRKNQRWSELSNFAPFGFDEGDVHWPTVEHYFQAQKFLDLAYREQIRLAHSPMGAKTLGQTRKIPIRPDWENVKETIMKHALRQKFQHPELRSLLLSTKHRLLVEDSPYDRYWGVGSDRKGKNRLGVLLMEIREAIRSAAQPVV